MLTGGRTVSWMTRAGRTARAAENAGARAMVGAQRIRRANRMLQLARAGRFGRNVTRASAQSSRMLLARHRWAQAALRAPRQVIRAGFDDALKEVGRQLNIYVRQNVTNSPQNRTLEQYIRGEIPGLDLAEVVDQAVEGAINKTSRIAAGVALDNPILYRQGIRGIYNRTIQTVLCSISSQYLNSFRGGDGDGETLWEGVPGAVRNQMLGENGEFQPRFRNWLNRRLENRRRGEGR